MIFSPYVAGPVLPSHSRLGVFQCPPRWRTFMESQDWQHQITECAINFIVFVALTERGQHPLFFSFIYIPIRAAFGNSRLLQTERPKTPSPFGDRVVKGFRQNSTLCTFVYRMLSRRGCTAVAQMACAAPDIYVGRLELCQQIIICYVRGYTNSIYLSNKHTKRT